MKTTVGVVRANGGWGCLDPEALWSHSVGGRTQIRGSQKPSLGLSPSWSTLEEGRELD
jgi:hypothetical protein